MADNFKLDIDADGIALITWDMPGRSMNVIDLAGIEELSAIAIWNSIGTWCVTHNCAVPTPPRYLPAPPEFFQCEENGISIGNSFSIDSTSGARPNAHHGNP